MSVTQVLQSLFADREDRCLIIKVCQKVNFFLSLFGVWDVRRKKEFMQVFVFLFLEYQTSATKISPETFLVCLHTNMHSQGATKTLS